MDWNWDYHCFFIDNFNNFKVFLIEKMKLPNFNKAFEYENNFYLSCDITRISKILAQYELFKKTINLPGEIIECGVFKGASFCRFAMFRELFGITQSKKLIGFDTFDEVPKQTKYKPEKKYLDKFIKEAGNKSITKKQLLEVLKKKNCEKNVELIKGDIYKTVPKYVKNHPELKISLLNLDVDMYEPTKVILKYLYPKIVKGGILILDDYGVFPGETKAVDEYFKNIKIQKFGFCKGPCFIQK